MKKYYGLDEVLDVILDEMDKCHYSIAQHISMSELNLEEEQVVYACLDALGELMDSLEEAHT